MRSSLSPAARASMVCMSMQSAQPLIGDAGATHSRLRGGILALQRRTRIDGILLVGDNFYPCGVSGVSDPQWSKITEHFGPAHLPIYPVLGNHDYGDPQARGGAFVLCG